MKRGCVGQRSTSNSNQRRQTSRCKYDVLPRTEKFSASHTRFCNATEKCCAVVPSCQRCYRRGKGATFLTLFLQHSSTAIPISRYYPTSMRLSLGSQSKFANPDASVRLSKSKSIVQSLFVETSRDNKIRLFQLQA